MRRVAAYSLFAAAFTHVTVAQTNVVSARTTNGDAVRVSWTAPSTRPSGGYVLRATPLSFSDTLIGSIHSSWVWDAPQCPTNSDPTLANNCGYTSTTWPGLTVIGTQLANLGPNRQLAPMLLRPETFDARADFSITLFVDVSTPNGGDPVSNGVYKPNFAAGIVVMDADQSLPILLRTVTSWSGSPNRYWVEGKCNDANAIGGALAPLNGTIHLRVDWNWRLRRIEAYQRTSPTAAWGDLQTFDVLGVVNGGAGCNGARMPRKFRIGIGGRTWDGTYTPTNKIYWGYANFSVSVPDAGATTLLQYVDSAATAATIRVPHYIPYTFSIAPRGADGNLTGPFVSTVAVNGLITEPFVEPLPLTSAQITSKVGFHWDLSRERPTTTGNHLPFSPDLSGKLNYLTQTVAANRAPIAGNQLGYRSAWVARGESFLQAIPWSGFTIGTTTYTGNGGLLNIGNGAGNFKLYVIMRPDAGRSNALYDVMNKGSFAGDVNRLGFHIAARGSSPAMSMVQRATIANDQFGMANAGITRADVSGVSPWLWTWGNSYSGPYCHSRMMTGYVNDAIPRDGSWWNFFNVNFVSSTNAPGWSLGAVGTDVDGGWRAGRELPDGTPPNSTCSGSYTWTQPVNGDPIVLGASSSYNTAGTAANRLWGDVYEVLHIVDETGYTTADLNNLNDYFMRKYYLRCGNSANSGSVVCTAGACNASVVDTTATLGCAVAGHVRVLGSASRRCIAGRWGNTDAAQGNMVCLPQCPTLARPANLATCSLVRFFESLAPETTGPFVGNETALWTSFPFMPDAVFPEVVTIVPGANFLTLDATYRRWAADPVQQVYLSDPLYAAQIPALTPVTFAITARVHSGAAGMLFRVSETSGTLSFYRLLITPAMAVGGGMDTRSIVLERHVNGVRASTVATATAGNIPSSLWVNQWFTIRVTVNNNAMTIVVDDRTVFNAITDPAGLLPGWSMGLAASGIAHFANLTVTSACDAGDTVAGAVDGAVVTYTCPAGFEAAAGNAVRTCNFGTWTGSAFSCRVSSPAFNTSTLAMRVTENSVVGTVVGTVRASTTGTTVTYSVLSGNTNSVFDVDPCSGVVSVNRALLDFETQSVYTLSIGAMANNDVTSQVTSNLVITVTNVNEPPVCGSNPYVVSMFEVAAPGASATPLMFATDPENDNARWSIVFGNDNGFFAVNPVGSLTGQLSLAVNSNGRNVLDFETRPQLNLVVQMTDLVDTSLSTQCRVTVNVLNSNEAPTVLPNQVFTVDETQARSASSGAPVASVGSTAGVAIFDQDTSDTVQYSILSVFGGVMTDGNAAYTGATAFSINANTGVISLITPIVVTDSTQELIVDDQWLTRASYKVTVQARDSGSLTSVANVSVHVLVNSTGLNSAMLTSVSIPVAPSTAGNEDILLLGDNFNTLSTATFQMTYGPYTATGCTYYPAQVQMFGLPARVGCKTAGGVGVGHQVVLRANGVRIRSNSRFLLSYAPPVVNAVTGVDPSLYPPPVDTSGYPSATAAATDGGQTLYATGRELGAVCSNTTLTYGPPGFESKYAAVVVRCSNTNIAFRTAAGVGANLGLRVTVGGQSFVSPPENGITYAVPAIVRISPPAFAAYTIRTLPTTTPVDLTITGSSFGPYFDADGAVVTPVVTYGYVADPTQHVYTMTNCRKPNDVRTAHTSMTCQTVLGVGRDLYVSVSVAGQVSRPVTNATTQMLAYVTPTITRASGTGVFGANTAGGQLMSIEGSGFGVPAENGVVTPDAFDPRFARGPGGVRYGPYSGQNCRVVSDSLIECLSAEGTGANHVFTVTIAGQSTPAWTAGTKMSYSPPSIFSFAGVGSQNADTQGSEDVVIGGLNFGASWTAAHIAQYVWRADLGVSTTGLMNATYTAQNCAVTVPHTQITCKTAPGAGKALLWSLIIDGLTSSTPTTSYAPPVITAVADAAGNPVTDAVATTEIYVSGANFGPARANIDYVAFGPYRAAAANITWISHTSFKFSPGPGIGAHPVIVSVNGQVSASSQQTFSYRKPRVVSVTPRVFATDPVLQDLTVTGTGFGLDDAQSGTGVIFGNPADGSATGILPLTGGRVLPDGNHQVTFRLPPGLGLNRGVRIAVYRRGTEVTTTNAIISDPIVDSGMGPTDQDLPSNFVDVVTGRGSFFSYADPVVTDVSVTLPFTPEDQDFLTQVVGCTDDPVTWCGYVRIDVLGSNFGPNPASQASADSINRQLEFSDADTGTIIFFSSVTRVASWSHRTVTAYTKHARMRVRVRVTSKSIRGADQVMTSNFFLYQSLSPVIGSIVGTTTNIPTTGGAATLSELVQLTVANMDPTKPIRASVGGTLAEVYTPQGVGPLTPENTASQLVQGDGTATLAIRIPPGQGTQVPIVVARLEGSTWKSSVANSLATVSYAPPTITALGVQKPTASLSSNPADYAMTAYAVGARIAAPTDGSLSILITGTNLGTCPIITLGPAEVRFCADPVTGQAATAGVDRSHTHVRFVVPEGEGGNWPLVVRVGGQDTPVVSFSYAAPRILSFQAGPAGLPTQGGTTVVFLGENFGKPFGAGTGSSGGPMQGTEYRTADWSPPLGDPYPPRVMLKLFAAGTVPQALLDASPLVRADGYVPCLNVLRTHYTLNCTLPEGDGADIAVEILRSNDAAPTLLPAVFDYEEPTVSSAVCYGCDATDPAAATGVTFTTRTADNRLIIRADTVGGAEVVLTGRSLGMGAAALASAAPLAPSGHFRYCVFYSWPYTNSPMAGNGPICDGVETYHGEGEAERVSIVAHNHNSIRLRIPPGCGNKDMILSIGGNKPARPIAFAYNAPVITSMEPPLVGTDGGFRIALRGRNLCPAPLDTRSTPLTFPADGSGLPLSMVPTIPTSGVRIDFHRACITDVLRLDGTRPRRLELCALNILQHTQDSIVFLSAVGIGLNRTLNISIVDYTDGELSTAPAGADNIVSSPVTFSFAPPTVGFVDPRVLRLRGVDDGFTSTVRVSGDNYGRTDDVSYQFWSDEEKAVGISIGTVACGSATRITASGRTYLECGFTSQGLTAGYKPLSISVAGQRTTLPASDVFAFVVACDYGYAGRVNETCVPCPTGAFCMGYDATLTSPDARFVDPRPLSGFYALNTTEQMAACPEQLRIEDRQWCIAPCDPPGACLGNNYCKEGYRSIAPMWRCATCDIGYYKRAGECVRCPDSPAALFIGFILLVIVAAGVGFMLNKKQVNIAVISIGIDFFQVLAIFSQSRIAWPPVVKELFHVLSAFNLNIEIVAPECLVPDVSYKQKFWFIMILPLCVGFLLLFTFLVLAFNKAAIKGREKKRWFSHKPALMSSTLVLIYMLYLYLTRTTLDVFNCTPTSPPDGYTYLSVVFERCGVAGGTQLTLLPYGIAALIVYVAGYPGFIGVMLWRNKELVMEDQLLRAKGVGNDRLSNPHALHIRKTYGRSYYQFRPDYYFWVLVIILRKFFIALTAVIFNKNASFQMAACLLVMFLAYAAQVQVRPYLSPGDYDDVLKQHELSALTSPIHARLKSAIAGIETRGRKKVRRNLMSSGGKVDRAAVLGLLGSWLFNYNTVEAVMSFAAVIVCLMGIMYQANEVSSYYPESKDSVTSVVLAVIILAILYFFTVFITEIVILYNEDARAKKLAQAAKNKAAKGDKVEGSKGSGGATLVNADGELNLGKVENTMNPLFLSGGNGGDGSKASSGMGSSSLEAIMAQRTAPPTELWVVFRQSYSDIYAQLQDAQAQLAEAKHREQRTSLLGVEAAAADLGSVSRGPKAVKNQFAPSIIASGDGSKSGRSLMASKRSGPSLASVKASTASTRAAASSDAAE